MTPDSVVEHLDGLEQAGPCLRPRGVALVVDQLLLRAGEEALRGRVVPAVRPTAHATGDPMPGQQPPIMLAGIPAPAIRMGHQTLAGLATGQGHFESGDDQPAVDPRAHRPAHDPPRMQVLYRRQVEPTLAGRDMSDVGRPGPIGRPGMVSRLFSGPEAAPFLLQGGRVALAGESPIAGLGQGPLPGPEHALAEVEIAGDLGEALALLGDELDRLGLELGCEGPSCLRHRWTPGFELTLPTRRPPSVRKSN